jgi:cell fate (sporulation/competence/biofilm development) regulator YlbF (YheA/YmcA/DUF963 family)
MAIDTQQILAEAEKLGALVAQHPAVSRYKDAQKAADSDPDAMRLLGEFQSQIEKLARQEQSGVPVTDAQRQQIEALNGKIVSHIKIKALNMAQVEYVDLMRKVTQSLYKPFQEQPIPRSQLMGGAPRM